MIRLADIRAHLQSACPALRQVQGAAEFRAVKAAPPAHLMPAAWVVPIAEDARPSEAANALRQVQTTVFGVLLAVGDRADRRGEAAGDDLDAVKAALHAALIGWTPPGASGPVEYVGGDVLEVETAALWWLAKYQVNDILRAVQ
jgi:hypothetical protein